MMCVGACLFDASPPCDSHGRRLLYVRSLSLQFIHENMICQERFEGISENLPRTYIWTQTSTDTVVKGQCDLTNSFVFFVLAIAKEFIQF